MEDPFRGLGKLRRPYGSSDPKKLLELTGLKSQFENYKRNNGQIKPGAEGTNRPLELRELADRPNTPKVPERKKRPE